MAGTGDVAHEAGPGAAGAGPGSTGGGDAGTAHAESTDTGTVRADCSGADAPRAGNAAGDVGTARLVLHPLTVDEAERVVAGEPGPADRWAPGYPDAFDVKGVGSFLATCSISGDPTPFGTYEIRRRSDGYAVGGLGFHGPPDADDTVTVGYSVIASEHGKGYATEALRALLAHLSTLGVCAVKGDTDRTNLASQHVMEAVGMRLVGENDRLKYYALRF